MILYTEEHVNTEYEKVISFFIYQNFKIHCFFNKLQGIHNKHKLITVLVLGYFYNLHLWKSLDHKSQRSQIKISWQGFIT